MMTTDELWEALKEVAGANRDKSEIKTLIQVKREDVKRALNISSTKVDHWLLRVDPQFMMKPMNRDKEVATVEGKIRELKATMNRKAHGTSDLKILQRLSELYKRRNELCDDKGSE